MPYIGQRPATGEANSFKILDDISNYTLTFGSSDIDVSADTITAREHRFVTGQRVTYGNGGGTDPTGLSNGTVYYIIVEDRHTFKLAANASDAASGSAINISTQGSGASHTINVAFDGVNTKFKATHTNGTKADITQSGQLMVSVNGVLQQPHDNTTTPPTGYATDHTSTIIFSAAPASTDQFFGRLIASNFATFDISDNTVDNFTGDGNTSTFTLSKTPPNNESVLVTIDGVVQYPDDNSAVRAYTVSENVIDFASAPGNGVEIQVRHIGFAGASTGGISGFYGRTGNAVLKSTDDIVFRNANVGVVTATDIRVTGNLTVDGTTTTLDTDLIGVDRIEVAANSTNPAIAVTQSGSGAAATFEGGSVGIGTNAPQAPLHLFGSSDILLEVESTDRYSHIDLTDNSSTARITNDGGTGTLRLRADKDNAVNNSNIQFEIDGSEKVRITSAGLVGIGTDDPSWGVSTGLIVGDGASAKGITLFSNSANVGDLAFADATSGTARYRGLIRYDHSDDSLALRTNSSEKLRITSAGKVGIGTDNPEDELHIFLDSSGDGPSLRLTNPNGGDGTYTGRISTGDAAGTFFAGINFLKHDSNDGEIRFRTKVAGTNTDVVTIVDGNVGVGLVNPTQKLTIAGNTQVENATFKVVAASPNIILSVPSGGIDSRIYNDGSGNFNIGHGANSDAPPAKLSITTSGNVGIGSTIPREKLDIGAGRIILDQDYQFTWANGTTNRVRIYGDSGNNFVVENGSSNTERFRISSNGAVGIGTNSPSAKLHISNGNANDHSDGILLSKQGGNVYGIYPSTNNLEFKSVTGNTHIATFDYSGNIGIGTDNPSAQSSSANNLVVADFAGEGGITIKNGSSSSGNIFFADEAAAAQGRIQYNHANDYLRFFTGGDNERLRVDSSGRIGIGTNNPDMTLHLYDSTAFAAFTNNGDTGESGILFRRHDNNHNRGKVTYSFTDDALLFRASNNGSGEDLRITSAGRIGIGVDNPQHLLHLKSAGDATILIQADSDNSGENDNPRLLFAQDGSTNGMLELGLIGDANQPLNNAPVNSCYIQANNHIDQPLCIGTMGENVMTVRGERVGIGTNNPTEALHVIGQNRGSAGTGSKWDIARFVAHNYVPTNSGGLTIGAYWNNTTVAARRAYIQSSQNTNSGSTVRDLLLNPDGGNIGIGRDDPSYLLDIRQYTNTTGTNNGTTMMRLQNNVGSNSGSLGDITGVNGQRTYIDFTFIDGNVNFTPQVRIGAQVGETSGSDAGIESEGSGSFVVYTAEGIGDTGAGSLVENLRVDPYGNVGVSSAVPHTGMDLRRTNGSFNKTMTSSSDNAPHMVVRNRDGNIRYFEYYFNCSKAGNIGTSIDKNIIDITNMGNFFQGAFEVVYGTRLQGISDSTTSACKRLFGINKFNQGNVVITDTDDIDVDSNSNTHANLHFATTGGSSVRLKVTFSGNLGASSFCSGVVRGWGVSDTMSDYAGGQARLVFYNGGG